MCIKKAEIIEDIHLCWTGAHILLSLVMIELLGPELDLEVTHHGRIMQKGFGYVNQTGFRFVYKCTSLSLVNFLTLFLLELRLE